MARHDIHGRRLQIESISHTDQSDDDVRVFAENVLRYQNSLSTKVLTGLDLVYADWVFAILESSNYIDVTGGGPLPDQPVKGDVHIMDDGSIMQYNGEEWINNGSIPSSGGSLVNEDGSLHISDGVISVNISRHEEEFTADGISRIFNTAEDMVAVYSVFINGMKLKRSDYLVIDENTIQIQNSVTLLENDSVCIEGTIYIIPPTP